MLSVHRKFQGKCHGDVCTLSVCRQCMCTQVLILWLSAQHHLIAAVGSPINVMYLTEYITVRVIIKVRELLFKFHVHNNRVNFGGKEDHLTE